MRVYDFDGPTPQGPAAQDQQAWPVQHAFNLTAVAADLPPDRGYDQFRKLVKIATSIESTISDLEDCRAAIVEARKLEGAKRTPSMEMTLEALMVYAVITYARATHSLPTADRFPVGSGRHPDSLRDAHRLVVALRDRVLAHYGHGADQLGGPWREEPLIMLAGGTRIRFGFPSRRTVYRQQVVDQVSDLVEATIPHLQETLR